MKFGQFIASLSSLALASVGLSANVDLVASTAHTFAVLPATSITDGNVEDVSWSPDGEHLLVTERPDATPTQALLSFSNKAIVPGPLTILGWDRSSHQVKPLWSADQPSARVESISWLRTTSVALLTMGWEAEDGAGVKRTHYGVISLDVANGQFRWIAGLEDLTQKPIVSPSPVQGQALIAFNDQEPPSPATTGRTFKIQTDTVSQVLNLVLTQVNGSNGSFTISAVAMDVRASNYWTIGRTGLITHSIHLDKPLDLPVEWNSDGSQWLLREEDPATHRSYLAKLSDQGLLTPTTEVAYEAPEVHRELDLDETNATIESGDTKVAIHPVWLHGTKAMPRGRLLLAADAREGQLSPSERGVFYIDHGVAKVREIEPITPQQVSAAEAQEKAKFRGEPVFVSFVTSDRATVSEPPSKP